MKAFCVALLALLISGCSWLPKREPVERVVTEQVLYCPAQTTFPRPNYANLETPTFYVVDSEDERLRSAGRMICVTADGYEAIGELVESFIQFAEETRAVLDQYEDQVDRNNERQDNE